MVSCGVRLSLVGFLKIHKPQVARFLETKSGTCVKGLDRGATLHLELLLRAPRQRIGGRSWGRVLKDSTLRPSRQLDLSCYVFEAS